MRKNSTRKFQDNGESSFIHTIQLNVYRSPLYDTLEELFQALKVNAKGQKKDCLFWEVLDCKLEYIKIRFNPLRFWKWLTLIREEKDKNTLTLSEVEQSLGKFIEIILNDNPEDAEIDNRIRIGRVDIATDFSLSFAEMSSLGYFLKDTASIVYPNRQKETGNVSFIKENAEKTPTQWGWNANRTQIVMYDKEHEQVTAGKPVPRNRTRVEWRKVFSGKSQLSISCLNKAVESAERYFQKLSDVDMNSVNQKAFEEISAVSGFHKQSLEHAIRELRYKLYSRTALEQAYLSGEKRNPPLSTWLDRRLKDDEQEYIRTIKERIYPDSYLKSFLAVISDKISRYKDG